MKIKTIGVAAGLTLLCGTAYAQSSVTLYGLIDEGVRFSTNQASSTGASNKLSMAEGMATGNRWGLKGTEDLGGGNSVFFDLQSGFNPGTGASDQQGQLFGRYAFVGLANKTYGRIALGRIYGAGFDFESNFDAVHGGNAYYDDFEEFITGIRFDNSVQYANTWGPVSLEVQRSFGNQSGSIVEGSTTAFNVIYKTGAFKGGLLAQQSKDVAQRSMYAGGIGGTYDFGRAVLYAYYLYSRRDAGFVAAANNSGGSLANTNLIGNSTTSLGALTQTKARVDNLMHVGTMIRASADLDFTLAGLYDHVSNVSAGQSGNIASFYGVADYILSPRTDVYFEVDHTILGGAAITDPNSPLGTFGGKDNSTGATLALRTRF